VIEPASTIAVGDVAGSNVPAIVPPAASSALEVAAADPDQTLIGMWLDGLSPHTQRGYRRSVDAFKVHVPKPLREVTLGELQAYAAHLKTLDLVDGSRHYALSAVKSVFAFATRLGYLQYDVAKPLRLPAGKDTLSERILEEADVRKLITGETKPRNRLMLQLLYVAGLRRSEISGLTWGDCHAHRGGGQLTIFGKGRKTRVIRLEPAIWSMLDATRPAAAVPNTPVFAGRGSAGLSDSQVLRIVKTAAKRAGISADASPHWLRHSHASHALDHGAPIHLVQQTLGHTSVATTSRYLHARPNESSSRFIPPV
jgi:integrase/recombinase XerD